MAFKFPLNNEENKNTIDKVKSNANGLLNTAFGLGPLGIAAYYNHTSIKANSPDFLSKAKTNQAGDIHSRVGESFDRFNLMRKEVMEAKKLKTKKQFEKVDEFVENLAQSKRAVKTAFISNLSNLLNDPNVLEGGDRTEILKRIEKLLEDSFEQGDGFLKNDTSGARNSLIKVLEEIKKSDPDGSALKKVGGFRSSAFSSVSDLLVAPQKLNLKGLNPGFTEMNRSNLSTQASSVFDHIRGGLDSNVTFQFLEKKETIGGFTGKAEYVRIFNSRNREIGLLPLNLREFANKGMVPVRFGNGNTMYAGPQLVANAEGLNKIVKENADVGARAKAVTAQLNILGNELRQGSLVSSNNPFQVAEMAIADTYLQGIRAKGGTRYVTSRDISNINSNISQMLEFVERMGGDKEVNKFLAGKYRSTGMNMKITGQGSLSAKDQYMLRPLLSQMHGLFDFSADPVSRGFFNFSAGSMSLNQGALDAVGLFRFSMAGGGTEAFSVLGQAASIFGGEMVDRATQPIPARYRQMYNRDEYLANTRNLAEDTRGRTVAFLDVKGKERLGLGEGMGFYHGNNVVKKAITKPINAPDQVGGVSAFLFEELRYRASMDTNSPMVVKDGGEIEFKMQEFDMGGKKVKTSNFITDLIKERGLDSLDAGGKRRMRMEGNKLIYKNIDDFYKLFGNKMDNYGIFLGVVDGRRQIFQRYSGIKEFNLQLSEQMESRGTTKYSITGSRANKNPFMKIFSTGFKGIVESTGENTFEEMLRQRGGVSQGLSKQILKFGAQSEGIYAAEASMMKKASMNLAEQIMTSLNVLGVSNENNMELTQRLAKRVGKSKGYGEQNALERQKSLITGAIEKAIESYGKDFSDEAIEKQGLTFGYFSKAMGVTDPEKGVYGVTEQDFFGTIKKQYESMNVDTSSSEYKRYESRLKAQVEKGYVTGHFKTFVGPQASTLGANLGSMEPRIYNFLSHQLRTLGLESDKVGDFMFSLLARKQGTVEDIGALKEYTKVMRSLGGADIEADLGRTLNTISVDDFINQTAIDGDPKLMRRFLEGQSEGFILDFSQNQELKTLFANAKKGSGKLPNQIYIPAGQEFLDMIDNERTLIPSEEGMKEIDSKYMKTLQKFSLNLSDAINSRTFQEKIRSLSLMQEFKEEMSEFYGMKFRNVLRGKIQGSTFALGSAVNLGRFSDATVESVVDTTGTGKFLKMKEVTSATQAREVAKIYADITADSYGKDSKIARSISNMTGEELVEFFNSEKSQIRRSTFDRYMSQQLGSPTYSESEKYLMRKIQRTNKGSAIFATTDTFLASMQSFMGGTSAESTMNRTATASDAIQAVTEGRADSRKELQQSLKNFFLGSYDTSVITDRNINITNRHPAVGLEHTALNVYFRNVKEAHGADIHFERIKDSREGRAALRELEIFTGKQFTGFEQINDYMRDGSRPSLSKQQISDNLSMIYQDEFDLIEERLKKGLLDEDEAEGMQRELLRKLDNTDKKAAEIHKNFDRKKVVDSFFRRMTYFMGDMATGAGGGSVAIPEMMTKVMFGKKERTLDLSYASGMIGDFDGDIYQLIFPSRTATTKLGLEQKDMVTKVSERGMLYRARTQMLFDMAKEGIANVAADLKQGVPTNVIMSISEDAMKEQIGKNVGPLDVALDALRLGLINSVDANNAKAVGYAADAINLLGVVQEVANIKGKKLPTASPIAETLATSINAMIDSGGKNKRAVDLFEKQIREVIFRRADLEGSFGKVTGATGGLNKHINAAIEGKRVIEMERVMNQIQGVLQHVLESGYREQKTERRIALSSMQEYRAQTQAFQGMLNESVQAKLMGGEKVYGAKDLEGIQNRLFSYINKNLGQAASGSRLGIIAAGLGGSLFLGSSMGYGGYSPEPLLMEGEIVSPELSDAIRSGAAFDAGPSKDDFMAMQNSVNNDIIDRNINLGETIMRPNNSFRMMGQTSNRGALSDLTSIVNQMGGRGHVTMNDTRSPISEHYVRRKFLGE